MNDCSSSQLFWIQIGHVLCRNTKWLPMKKIIYIAFIALWGFSSCGDEFLDNPPENQITVDNFFNTDEQVLSTGKALYSMPWFYFNYHLLFCIGDVYSGNSTPSGGDFAQFKTLTVNSGNSFVHEGYYSLFYTVAAANTLLNNLDTKVGDEVSELAVEQVRGEAYLTRAIAYFYIAQIWGPMPILDKMDTYYANAKLCRNTLDDMYIFINSDLEKAEIYLPDTRDADGRACKDVARSFIAKVALTRGDYACAAEKAKIVIDNGQFALMDDYGQLFKDQNDNNIESIYAFQWMACMGWGYGNTTQAWTAPYGEGLTQVGDGWGSYIPSLDLLSAYEKEDERRYYTVMEPGNYYPDLKTKEGGYTYIGSTNSGSGAHFKKYVVGSPDEADVCYMETAINTYIMRYADVLLMYAEAVLADNITTNDASALEAFNAVRARAGIYPKTEIAIEDILQERRVEFAYEGSYWFDLARIDRTKAKQMMMDQERGHLTSGVVTSKRLEEVLESDFLLPIPQVEIDKNPNLNLDPVPYY